MYYGFVTFDWFDLCLICVTFVGFWVCFFRVFSSAGFDLFLLVLIGLDVINCLLLYLVCF